METGTQTSPPLRFQCSELDRLRSMLLSRGERAVARLARRPIPTVWYMWTLEEPRRYERNIVAYSWLLLDTFLSCLVQGVQVEWIENWVRELEWDWGFIPTGTGVRERVLFFGTSVVRYMLRVLDLADRQVMDAAVDGVVDVDRVNAQLLVMGSIPEPCETIDQSKDVIRMLGDTQLLGESAVGGVGSSPVAEP